ncbi:MAG: glycosyltransferase family 4 protein [Gammaproteobacteria bacterium]
MRIGLSCTTIEPAISQGKIDGIGTYTKNLYEEFLNRGRSVVPFAYPNGGIAGSALPEGRLLPFSYTLSTMVSLANPLPLSLHGNLKQHIDLFHATDHMIPKLKNVPVIATVHDALMFQYPQWFYNTRFATLKKWARKKSLSWADHVITGANAMIPELVEFCGIKPEKISVVSDGISPWWSVQIPTEEKERLLAKFKLPKNFVLFTGTLHPKKNLPRLIQAFLQLPTDIQKEFPLVIAGRAGWDTQASLAAIKVLENKLLGRWLDYVTLEELRALFQSATLYAHPSLHEGFGLTLLQAFASGTPVLTSNITAMPETAGGAAYLVNPHSVDSIRDGLKMMLSHTSLREDLMKKGLERVKNFSWVKCAEQTLAVYEAVV